MTDSPHSRDPYLRFGMKSFATGLLAIASLIFWVASLFLPAAGPHGVKAQIGIECFTMSLILSLKPSGPDGSGMENLCRLATVLHLCLLGGALALLDVPPFRGRGRYVIAFVLIAGASYFWLRTDFYFGETFAGYRLWLTSFYFMGLALLLARNDPAHFSAIRQL